MSLPLQTLVDDFANALLLVDQDAPRGPRPGRTEKWKPGVGALDEVEAVRLAVDKLRQWNLALYGPVQLEVPYPAAPEKRCDIVIPGAWAIEVKMLRPYRDNGDPEPSWAKDILSPYGRDNSAVADVSKLLSSGFSERKAVLIYGFSREYEGEAPLSVAATAFEAIVQRLLSTDDGFVINARYFCEFGPLMHSVHQQGMVFAWEVIPVGFDCGLSASHVRLGP